MDQISLNGSWQMKRTDKDKWLPAFVPGSVYNDLLNNGMMDDPFYRDNEYGALQLMEYDYEYIKKFEITKDFLSKINILLRFEGLDTLCSIYLNSDLIGSSKNMHRTYEYDIKRFVCEGENTLSITFHSPVKYVRQKDVEFPLRSSGDALSGITHLRKAHCMFGWDWGPKLPDAGIWRNVSIIGYDMARITDVHVRQHHKKDHVDLSFDVTLDGIPAFDTKILIKITSPCLKTTEIICDAVSSKVDVTMKISDPKLWWPNNLGDQPLYHVQVMLYEKDIMVDEKFFRIGLRTLTVNTKKDEWGESFEFVVNGESFFAMGADYIPEDSLLSRKTYEKTEVLIRSCKLANFNCIRVWGGGHYPDDQFYDLCDEHGMVIWQDFMFACGVYRFDEDFENETTQEAEDNIKRLRNHACLGLWCGNNEQEEGWVRWGWSSQYSIQLKQDYIKQFELQLPAIVKREDPDTFYWPSSPSSFGAFTEPNSQDYGDVHYWGVWHGKEPFTKYRELFPRFMSEFGIQSFPDIKTVNTFTKPEDRNIFSPVMESHQKNGTANEKILYYISQYFRFPKNFDSLIYLSQLLQAEGMRYGVEHWRRNRGRCMGAIYWQLNDCWPVASWSGIDYYLRWKALHYFAKRFYSPVLASAFEVGNNISLSVTNETGLDVTGILAWKLRDQYSKVIKEGTFDVSVAPFLSAEIALLDFSQELDTVSKKRSAYFEHSFIVNNVTICAQSTLFVPAKHFDLKDPKISFDVTDEGTHFVLTLISEAFARYVKLDLSNGDAIFNDNYFDLHKGEIKKVYIDKDNIAHPMTLDEFKEGLIILDLYNSFE